jgi:hypothetical protein
MASFHDRLKIARKYVPQFGLGAYCGFGRMAPAEMTQVLHDHLEARRIARQ